MAVSISLSITQNSQNIANNTSNVTVKVTAKWTYGSWNANSKSGWLKIDGTKYTFSSSFNTGQSTSGSQTLFTKTVNVSHNDDGTKKLSCSASYTSGVSSGTVTCSGSKTLTTIARKSSISEVIASALGSASTIKVEQQSTSFTHTLTYTCGTASGTIATKSSDTSISWTPPLSLASQNTTGDSLTVVFTLETFNETASIGTSTWTSYAYTIPTSVVPSVSLDVADVYSYRGTYGAYVQNKSKLQIDITAAGAYGSTIDSYKTTIDGKTYTSAAITTGVLAGSGEMTITTTVTDSRGRKATTTWDITVLEYAAPKLTSLNAKRSNSSGAASSSGAYLTITFGSEVSPLNNQNTATYKIQYKKTSETSYTTATLSGYANNYAVSGGTYTFAADTASSYDIILSVTDGFGSNDRTATGSSISKVWSILAKGKGLAIGKVAELSNYFEVAWQSLFRNHVGVGNKTGVTDGKTGVFLHKDGTVTLQRTSNDSGYGPFIGFLHDDNTSYAAVLQTSADKCLRFSYANKYRFGSNVVLPNAYYLFGEDADGTERNLMGLNASNNLLVGWDLYDKALGNLVLYGNNIRFNSNGGFYVNNVETALAFSAITVHTSATQTLTTSAAKISMATQFSKRGDAFSLSNGGVLCNKACTVEISGNLYVGSGLTSNDYVIVQAYINSTNMGTVGYARTTTTAAHIPIPSVVMDVEEGDYIYLYAYNSVGARGAMGAFLGNRLSVREV